MEKLVHSTQLLDGCRISKLGRYHQLVIRIDYVGCLSQLFRTCVEILMSLVDLKMLLEGLISTEGKLFMKETLHQVQEVESN